MDSRTLRLNYPPSLAGQPILHQLIRGFELTVNLRQAQISLEEGWLEAEVQGAPAEIERAIAWLAGQGVGVERLP